MSFLTVRLPGVCAGKGEWKMDTTKERARRKCYSKARLEKQWQNRRANVPADLPDDFTSDLVSIYEVWEPATGRIVWRHLSRRLAHSYAGSGNALRMCDDDPVYEVRERQAVLCSLKIGGDSPQCRNQPRR